VRGGYKKIFYRWAIKVSIQTFDVHTYCLRKRAKGEIRTREYVFEAVFLDYFPIK
jgi:hypothetical protein